MLYVQFIVCPAVLGTSCHVSMDFVETFSGLGEAVLMEVAATVVRPGLGFLCHEAQTVDQRVPMAQSVACFPGVHALNLAESVGMQSFSSGLSSTL